MKVVKLANLDYRYILIQQYKALGLNEYEVMVLLLIDSLNHENPSLITGDQLQVKMSLSEKEIDQIIVDLTQKGFLSYENVGEILVTSMKKTYDKLIGLFTKEIINADKEEQIQISEDALARVLKLLEKEMNRSLTPLEIEQVDKWFKDGISEELIIDAINESSVKHTAITIKRIDKILIKNIQSSDRHDEGASTVDEKTKLNIKKALEIASYDWVNDDE